MRRTGVARHDDLFEIFPDLPRPMRHSIEQQRARVLNLIARARARAAENAVRQQEQARRAREEVAARQERLRTRARGRLIR